MPKQVLNPYMEEMDLLCYIIFWTSALCSFVFLLIFGYFQYAYTYWKRQGIPYLEPTFPWGNSKNVFIGTATYTNVTADWYRELKTRGHKFGGAWDLCRPCLVIVDPDYIRDITTKDFHHFIDRDFYSHDKADPQRDHLFAVRSEKWKSMRQKLTPTFTSGKMKMMFNGIVECSHVMVDFLTKESNEGKDIELKQVMSSFTIDVIGSCAFGIDLNSFDNPNDEFRWMGSKIFEDRYVDYILFPLIRAIPELCYKMNMSSSNQEVNRFFANLVTSTMEYRRKNGVTRPDFIQLLIDLTEDTQESDDNFDIDTIVANTLLFFVAGFDTSSSTMHFALYELARNSEIQKKTREEISRILEKHEGKLTYEAIKDMTYLRQVIDETLRLYPSVQTLARKCTKDYQLRDTNITIRKGTPIVISPLGLGRDPEYFPNPEQFDPDRFDSEYKANLRSHVYIPFGEGPRNCIGLRFGLMQTSIGIIQVLKNFNISISPSTEMPLTLSDRVFLIKSNETLYLKMEKIT